jgi:hypothetical protein
MVGIIKFVRHQKFARSYRGRGYDDKDLAGQAILWIVILLIEKTCQV